MSVRRDVPLLAETASRRPTSAISVPQTISDRLGIEQRSAPAKWPAPFQPQFKKVPVVVGSVVSDAFDDHGADPTGLFGKSKAPSSKRMDGALAKKGSMMGNIKARAKEKANAAVRKGVASAKAGAKAASANAKAASASAKAGAKVASANAKMASASAKAGAKVASASAKAGAKVAGAAGKAAVASVNDKMTGMQKFDYAVMDTDEFTGVLSVARKTNSGTDLDAKNNIAAFKKYKHSQVVEKAAEQESQMLHKEGLVKKIKGKGDKVAARAVPGRHAAVLGYSRVSNSKESNTLFASSIFDPEAPAAAGVPTIVQLSVYDTNKESGMMPISALVVEPLDTDTLEGFDSEILTVTMQAVPEANQEEVVNRRTRGQVEFDYTLCVHGLYVGADKTLMAGRKILVYQKDPSNIAAYGIATPRGIESALYHAMKGTEIDLLYLWACFRLVQGVHSLATQVGLSGTKKAALKELLGTSLGTAVPYSFAEDEDDEFDEVNLLPLKLE